MELIIFVIIVWLISPVALLVLWALERRKKQRMKDVLLYLHSQKKITDADLRAAGLLPQYPAAGTYEPVPPPAVQLPRSENDMEAAAARAAAIAEAELSGKPIPEPEPALPPAVPQQAVAELLPQTHVIFAEEESAAEIYAETEEPAEKSAAAAEESAEEIQAAAEASEAEPSAEQAVPAFAEQPHEAAPKPEFRPLPEPQLPAADSPQGMRPAAYDDRQGTDISAISVMLSVGVALIVIAGLIFVRTAWESMSGFGRLATLAAGCGLFFGASALADRAWQLERTSMAFFTLGAVFVPISVWAAGYFHLLGDGLSDPSNPWLFFLAFAAFSLIALLAVRRYRMNIWGIAALGGIILSYLTFAGGLEWSVRDLGDSGEYKSAGIAVFVLAVAVMAPVLTFTVRLFKDKLPDVLAVLAEPFSLVYGLIAALLVFRCFAGGQQILNLSVLLAAAFFLIAAAVFAAPVSDRLEEFAAIPFSIYSIAGFGLLLYPVYDSLYGGGDRLMEGESNTFYTITLFLACALLEMILLLTNSLPDTVKKGYFYAAFGLTASALPLRLLVAEEALPVMLVPEAILIAVWMIAVRRKPALPGKALVTALWWLFAFELAANIGTGSEEPWYHQLMFFAAAMFILFALSVPAKTFRTAGSDLVFTVSAACAVGAAAMEYAPDVAKRPLFLAVFVTVLVLCWYLSLKKVQHGWLRFIYAAVVPLGTAATLLGQEDLIAKILLLSVLAATLALNWYLALHNDGQTTPQYFHAAVVPLMLAAIAVYAEQNFLQGTGRMILLWTAASAAAGAVVYYTTKRRFHFIRRLMFAMCVVPAILLGFISAVLEIGKLVPLHQALCALIALWLFYLCAGHGFRKISIPAFASAVLLTLLSTGHAVRDAVFDGRMRFTVYMIVGVWLIALCAVKYAISARMLTFPGREDVSLTASVYAAFFAVFVSVQLLALNPVEWEPFCFFYCFGFGVLAWFTTTRRQMILPGICAFAMILSVESLRERIVKNSPVSVLLQILFFAAMTLLFPYIGNVLRESEDDPAEQRRSWILTAVGGIMPLWLMWSSFMPYEVVYGKLELKWIRFAVLVLISAYVLHFAVLCEDNRLRRTFQTASAAVLTVAFWLMPFFDVKGTLLEGKLHLLPLVGFAIVVRRLYGQKAGGNFLFAVGVYTMGVLAFAALLSEEPGDLLIVLAVALVMFVVSFYVRQKKWFLLGGGSLVLTGIYMHMKLTDGKQWWVYLLLAGLALIIVAASNETLKQRGDSLKSHAGRLWEDWTW